MEDLRLYSFTVKCHKGDYSVGVNCQTVFYAVKNEIEDGDVVIIDKNVYSPEHYPDSCLVITANEETKSYLGVEKVIAELIDMGFKRNNRLLAVGGGITQDVTSFIASVLYRGVEWMFFPTTLLAQADSCIGSKTSINFGEYKNQLGGFYPPTKICIDTCVLKGLPEKELISGLGEMCHYFLIGGKECYEELVRQYDRAVAGDQDTLGRLISTSLQIKKKMIEIDEFDKGPRNIFNYGHTFGHAIETMSEYEVPHGIAVAIGMDIANYVSSCIGLVDRTFYEEVHEFLSKVYSGTDMSFLDIETYLDALRKDKKNENGKLGLILTSGYGNMFKHMTPCDESFRQLIEDYFQGEYK